MFTRVIIGVGLVSASLLLIIMTTYEPSAIGALGIFVVFFLGYVVVLTVLSAIFWTLVSIARRTKGRSRLVRKISYLSPRDVYYYSSVIALAPVILISLRSVGAVGVYEFSLVAVFVGLACLFIAKRTG
jgi:hypothetical protein